MSTHLATPPALALPELLAGLASGIEPAQPAPAGAAALVLEQRLAALEQLGGQTSEAIEQLVDAVVGLRELPPPAPVADTAGPAALQALQAKLHDLEQQSALERCCRDLEHVSRMHPKDRSVVFVGTTFFGCNVKYAWLAFREAARREGVTAWFLPQNPLQQRLVAGLGENCFPVNASEWTPDHFHTALSAAVVVTCDHLLNPNPYAAALLAGARHVQLWHGVSIKEIGLRNLPPLKQMSPRFARVLATCGPFAKLVGTAASAEAEWRRWFAFDRYAPIGYPRNDVLFREPDAGDLLNVDTAMLAEAQAAQAAGRRVVLYAPTFRDAKRGSWIIEAGLERIARELAERGDLLIVNLHPVEQPQIPQLREAAPTARFVAPRTDIYPLLAQTSLLITDYSSVMFDYLLLDKPIVLFRPDHAEYVARSRRLFEDKLAERPGPLVDDARELLKLLRQPDAHGRTHAQTRQALRSRLFDRHDGHSGERLSALLLEEIVLALNPGGPTAAPGTTP
ncbi:MAG TPA: CDP-glycerol glycerophosphotransferase family protein [Ideonella sp.]|nr:CDP-glycerol glycerophosphotransferase family protein [Ideonella sp.]